MQKIKIHPFLEEVVRWVDADYSKKNAIWKKFSLGCRLNCILETICLDFAEVDGDATVRVWQPAGHVSSLRWGCSRTMDRASV